MCCSRNGSRGGSSRRIRAGTLLRGEGRSLAKLLATFEADPATGVLGELGLGTQVLPPAGADIQDEKILAVAHAFQSATNFHLKRPPAFV